MRQRCHWGVPILLFCLLASPSMKAASTLGIAFEETVTTIVYIIDCSCSMDSGWSSFTGPGGQQMAGYRMDRAKAEVAPAIRDLPSDWWFDVVSTDHPGYGFFGELTATSSDNTAAAIGHIYDLHGGGETGLAPAVTWALSNYAYHDVFDYVIVTGGVPTCCVDDHSAYWTEVADRIRGANERNARVHMIVIWPDPEDPVLDVAETITSETGGMLVVID